MKRTGVLLILLVLGRAAPETGAAVVHVPGDVPRVTTAVDNASPGDTILVAPGTYSVASTSEFFPIVLDTEGIWLQGAGAEVCTLDAAGTGQVLRIENVATVRVSGFTVTGGAGYVGGGLATFGSDAEIDHNVFHRNGAFAEGSGIYVNGGTPWIHHNVVWESFDRDLVDPGDPHGIQSVGSAAVIEHNLVGRTDSNGLLIAGGTPLVRNNIFLENGLPGVRGRGICAFGDSGTVVVHNLFHGNEIASLLIDVGSGLQDLTASQANDGNPGDGVYGNLDGDPLLADPDQFDWALTALSPAIDSGDPTSPLDPDGTPADLGPFFFDQSTTSTRSVAPILRMIAAPNPFRASTAIGFSLDAPGPVRVEVFTITGRRVAELAEARFPAGAHRVSWDGRDDRGSPVGAGVYLLRLTAGGEAATTRVVLLR
jgi:hypothetical protein